VVVVGLTGGMGSGKSTVARLLADRGAHVIDADAVAREVVAPGEPALDEIAARFGGHLVRDDGSLDRAGLAALVFDDETARADLEAITHPRIAGRIEARLERFAAEAPPGSVAVVDHPLLVETGQADRFDALVVVLAPVDVRVERLAAGRGVDPEDARARMAVQADDDERRAVATHVIGNDGDLAALEREVDRVWHELERLAAA
jgi:dephospho-CoA kinase